MLKTFLKKTTCVIAVGTHLAASNAALAQPTGVVIDQSRNLGTLIDVAGNGVPVIHTTAPNEAGVSHNVFTGFNVGREGLIINNSLELGQSQLGGFLLANPNLMTGGIEADLIINEVTGGNRSLLLGFTEIFGGEADLVIANPYGITCDGCGFVNTPRVTLATGTPEFGSDGVLAGLNVTGGDVLITGAGLNASNVDFFDIVTRSAKINADLIANDLGVYAGSNRFDYEGRDLTALAANSDVPLFAIDSSALGGMFANRIRLIGTEAGVGINLQGLASAVSGDLEITADGQIALTEASAAENIRITSTSNDIAIRDRIFAEGNVDLSADGEISITNGFAAARGDVTVSGDQLALNDAMVLAGVGEDGTLSGDGDLNIAIDGTGVLTDSVVASARNVGVEGNGLALDAGSQIAGDTISLVLNDTLQNSGTIASEVGLDIVAGDIVNNDGASLSAGGTLQITAAAANGADGTFTNRGLVQAAGDLVIETEGDVLSDGRFATSSDADITAENLIAIGVGATATNAGSGDAGTGSNDDGATGAGSGGNTGGEGDIPGGGLPDLPLTPSPEEQRTSANLDVAGDATLNADEIRLGGTAIVDGEFNADAHGNISIAGVVSAVLGLNASSTDGDVSVDGSVLTGGDAALDAGGSLYVNETGIVNADGNIALSATGNVSVEGQTLSGNAQAISGGSAATLSGTVQSGNDLTVTAFDASLAGDVTSFGAIDIEAQVIGSTALSETLSVGTISLQGGAVDLQGRLASDSDVAIDGTDISLGGLVENQGVLDVTASNDLTIDGDIANIGGVTGSAGNDLAISASGDIASDDTVDLTAGSNFTHEGAIASGGAFSASSSGAFETTGQISALDQIVLQGGSLLLGGTIGSNGTITAIADGSLKQTGRISALGDVTLANSAGGIVLDTTAVIESADAVAITSGGIFNNVGAIEAGTDITLSAASDIDHAGSASAGGDITINAAGNVVSSGSLAASGTLSTQGEAVSITSAAADGGVTVLARSANIDIDGEVSSVSDISLTAAAGSLAASIDAQILSLGAIMLAAFDEVRIDGVVFGDAGIDLSANDVSLSGSVSTLGDLTVAAGNDVVIATGGEALADGAFDIAAGNAVQNAGTVFGETEVTIAADSVTNTVSGETISDGDIGLTIVGIVDNNGLISAGGDIALDTDIFAGTGTIAATGPVSLIVNDALSIAGTISSVFDVVVRSLTGNVSVEATGQVLAERDAFLDAAGNTIINGGVEAGRIADITAAGNATLNGTVFAGEALNTNAGGTLDLGADSQLESAGSTALSADIVNAGGTISANSDVLITATGNAIVAGDIVALSGITVLANNDLSLNGTFASNGLIMLEATNGDAVFSNNTLIESDDNVDIVAGGSLTIDGTVRTTNNITAIAASDLFSNGVVEAGGTIGYTAGEISVDGILAASSNITLDAQAIDADAASAIISNADVLINSTLNATLAGAISAGGLADLDIGGDLRNLGSLVALSTMVEADGNITNEGIVYGETGLTITAAGDIVNDGDALSDDALTFNAGGTLRGTGLAASAGNASLSGSAIDAAIDVATDGDLSVAASTGDAALGGVLSARGTSTLSAAGDLTFAPGASLVSLGAIQANSGGTINQAGLFESDSDITFNAGTDLFATGDIFSSGVINLTAINLINSSGTLGSTGAITVTGADIVLSGLIQTSDRLDVSGVNTIYVEAALTAVNSAVFTTSLGAIDFTNASSVLSNGIVSFNADGDLVLNGTVETTDRITGLAGGNLTNGGSLLADLGVSLDAIGTLNSSGAIASAGDITLLGAGVLIGDALTQGRLLATARSGDLTLTGSAAAFGDITFTALGSNINLNAPSAVDSLGFLTLDAAGALNVDGFAAGNLGLSATAGAITLNNTLSSVGDLNVTTSGDFIIGALGEALSGGEASFAANILTNSGTLFGAGSLVVAAGTLLSNENTGVIVSGGDANLTVGNGVNGSFNNSGVVSADDTITAAAGTISADGTIAADGNVNLTAQNGHIVSGTVSSLVDIVISSLSGDVTTQTGSTIVAGRDIDIDAANAGQLDGALSAVRNLDASAGASLSISGQAFAGDTATLSAGGAVSLSASGLVEAVGRADINGASANIAGGVVSEGDITIATTGNFTLSGILSALDNASISANRLTTTGTGEILAGDSVTINADLNNAGLIFGDRLIDVNAGGLLDNSGILFSRNHVDLFTSTGPVRNLAGGVIEVEAIGGNIATGVDLGAGANIFINSGGAVVNNGRIYTNGSLELRSRNSTISNSGEAIALSGLTVNAAAGITNPGTFQSGLDLSLTQGTDFINNGTLTAFRDLSLNAPNIINNGLLGAGFNLGLTATNDITNTGTLFAGNNLSLSLGGDLFNNDGLILSEGNLLIEGLTPGSRASSIVNQSGRIESFAGSVVLRGDTIENRRANFDINNIPGSADAGEIVAAGDVEIDSGIFENNLSEVLAGNNVVINTNTFRNIGAELPGTGGTLPPGFDPGGLIIGCFDNSPLVSICDHSGLSFAELQAGCAAFPSALGCSSVLFIQETTTFPGETVYVNTFGCQSGSINFSNGTCFNQSGQVIGLPILGSDDLATCLQFGLNGCVEPGDPIFLQFIGLAASPGSLGLPTTGGSPGVQEFALIQAGGTVSITASSTFENVSNIVNNTTPGTGGATPNVTAASGSATQSAVANADATANGTTTGGTLNGSANAANAGNAGTSRTAGGAGIGAANADDASLFADAGAALADNATLNGRGNVNAVTNTGPDANSTASGSANAAVVDSASTSSGGPDTITLSPALAVLFDGSEMIDGNALGTLAEFLTGLDLVSFGASSAMLNLGGDTLFVINNDPNAEFLFVTNPGLNTIAQFYDSEFFFDQLGVDRATLFTRLGDGYFEAQYVNRQIQNLTGQARLPQFGSALDQWTALMQNALDAQGRLNLTLGVALTAEQVASLDESIVWWVAAEVEGREVLVPVVYLAEADQRALQGGAVIAGNNVLIDAGNIANSGTIDADNVLRLSASGDIQNTGRLHGGTALIADAARDILNRGGTITGGDVGLFAGRDINNSYGVLAADGDLVASAGRDFVMNAGTASAAGSALIDAGRNIDIGIVETRTATASSFRTGKKRYGNSSSTTVTQQGSTLTAGGNLTLNAGNDISVAGSNLSAGGDAALLAGGDISITSVEESTESSSFERRKKWKITTEERSVTNVASTIQAGGDVIAAAGGNLSVIGSNLSAGDDIALAAAGDTTIQVAQDFNSSYRHEKKKGGFLGKKKENTFASEATTNAGGQLNAGGDVLINVFNPNAPREQPKGKDQSGFTTVKTPPTDSDKDASTIGVYAGTVKTSALGTQDATPALGPDGQPLGGKKNVSGVGEPFSGGTVKLAGAQDVDTANAPAAHDQSTEQKTTPSDLPQSGDVAIIGAEINAGGNIVAAAGGDLTVSAQEEQFATLEERKKKGLFSKKEVRDEWERTYLQGGELNAGGDVTLLAGNDATVNAGIVSSETGDIQIAAGLDGTGSVTITGDDESERQYHLDKSSGLFASAGGGGFSIGFRKTKNESETVSLTNAPSVIVAQAGDVAVSAADDINIAGSHVAAGESINLDAGRDVNITERRETVDHEEEHRQTQFGVSVGAYENVSGAVSAVTNAPGALTSGQGGAGATAVTAVSQGLATYGTVTGAINNAAGVNASLGFSTSKEELAQNSNTAYGSMLEAGEDINVNAGRDIGIVGSQVVAGDDISLAAGRNLTIESAQDYFEQETDASSAGVSVGVSVGVGVTGVTASASANASFNTASSNQSSVTQVNSVVAAGGDVSLSSGNDTTIAGANVSGTDIDIDVGGDLTVASRQDTAEGSNSSFGINAGVSTSSSSDYSTGFGDAVTAAAGGLDNAVGAGPSSGNVGVNVGFGSNSSAVVTNQTTVLGSGTVDINVGEHTQVDGAVIAAVDSETGENSGNLSLSTGTLAVTDIVDHDNSRQTNLGINHSFGLGGRQASGGDENDTAITLPDADGQPTQNTTAPVGSALAQLAQLPTVNFGRSTSDFEQLTQGAIGEGEIEVRDDPDFNPDSINRDIGETQLVTRDEQTSFEVNADFGAIADLANNFIDHDVDGDGEDDFRSTIEEAVAAVADLLDKAEEIPPELLAQLTQEKLQELIERNERLISIKASLAIALGPDQAYLLNDPTVNQVFKETYDYLVNELGYPPDQVAEALSQPETALALATAAQTSDAHDENILTQRREEREAAERAAVSAADNGITQTGDSTTYAGEEDIVITHSDRNEDTEYIQDFAVALSEAEAALQNLNPIALTALQVGVAVARSSSPLGAAAQLAKELARDEVVDQAASAVADNATEALYTGNDGTVYDSYEDYLDAIERAELDRISDANNENRSQAESDVQVSVETERDRWEDVTNGIRFGITLIVDGLPGKKDGPNNAATAGGGSSTGGTGSSSGGSNSGSSGGNNNSGSSGSNGNNGNGRNDRNQSGAPNFDQPVNSGNGVNIPGKPKASKTLNERGKNLDSGEIPPEGRPTLYNADDLEANGDSNLEDGDWFTTWSDSEWSIDTNLRAIDNIADQKRTVGDSFHDPNTGALKNPTKPGREVRTDENGLPREYDLETGQPLPKERETVIIQERRRLMERGYTWDPQQRQWNPPSSE